MVETNIDLYKYLINTFNIKYIEIPEEVQSNLNNDEKANIIYLGNYFLRSYKETYTFFIDNLDALYNSGFLSNKDTINILDFGAGTGGQIFGLLHALSGYYKNIKNINIYSIDGNSNALEIQKKIFDGYWVKNVNYSINLNLFIQEINDGNSLYNFLTKNFNKKFEIIITSKALSECVNNDNKIYFYFLKAVENLLDKNGICLISDITCQLNNNYIPSIVNHNIQQYYNDKDITDNNLQIILPICCFYNKNTCNKSYCYTQCKINMKIFDSNQILSKKCKIDFKLFLKKDILFNNIYNNLLSKQLDSNLCFINNSLCYCNSSDNYYKRVFGEIEFKNSQFSLKKYKENL